jgi:hypothetical protein
MAHLKLLSSLAVIALLSGLILAIASNKAFQPNATEKTPQPQLQVYSPQDNGTYQTVNVPLNITANNATEKIAYSLDGAENVTFSGNTTETSSLSNGMHNITFYGF